MTRPLPSLWTIDELGAQVALALATDYAGPPNGRVRDVPDRRTIRYYTTLGLLDRPVELRGRTALYGRRHLLQLVAIKRLQAQGLSLTEVQARLLGLTDAALARIARLPGIDSATPRATSTPVAEQAPDRRAGAFWAAPVAESSERAVEADVSEERADTSTSIAWQGVPFQEGAILLVTPARPLDEADVAALRVAAAPVLKLLAKRRLLPSAERQPT
jgi:DNA-binding transcriptional MerR regulator